MSLKILIPSEKIQTTKKYILYYSIYVKCEKIKTDLLLQTRERGCVGMGWGHGARQKQGLQRSMGELWLVVEMLIILISMITGMYLCQKLSDYK